MGGCCTPLLATPPLSCRTACHPPWPLPLPSLLLSSHHTQWRGSLGILPCLPYQTQNPKTLNLKPLASWRDCSWDPALLTPQPPRPHPSCRRRPAAHGRSHGSRVAAACGGLPGPAQGQPGRGGLGGTGGGGGLGGSYQHIYVGWWGGRTGGPCLGAGWVVPGGERAPPCPPGEVGLLAHQSLATRGHSTCHTRLPLLREAISALRLCCCFYG